MHGEWSPRELRAALSAIQDEGHTQGDIAQLAGVNRSQVNRWARGENRPTYDKALQLARRVARRKPELASRFMAAAGYSWDGEPSTEPDPLIPADLLATIRERFPPERAEQIQAAIEAVLRDDDPVTEPGAKRASAG